MKALRFCMLTTFYPPHHFGGDAITIRALSRGLVRAGHHVTVIHDYDAYEMLAPNPVDAPDEGFDDGVEVIRLHSGWGTLSPLLTQQLGRPVINGGRIRRLLAEGRFDVLNFHNISLIGGPGLLSYGGDAVRLYMAHEHWLVCPTHVLWRHNVEACTGKQCFRCTLRHRRPPQLWRYTGLLDRQLANVDAFIAFSEFSRDKHREFGFSHEMEVLPSLVPDELPAADTAATRSHAPHDRPYFFFAGRLERIKGVQDVIPLFRDGLGPDLVIAGDGEYRPTLEMMAAGSPRIRFIGRLQPEILSTYYRGAIALVVPSLCFETFGNVIVEAFRHRTPVIARRIGPFPELISQAAAGLLFSTPSELRGAMKQLVDEPEVRERLAMAAHRAYLDRWSERVVIPQYLRIVQRAVERRASRKVNSAGADRLPRSRQEARSPQLTATNGVM